MTIHHSQIKKAEKAGFQLSEQEDGTVAAFWPKRSLMLYGTSGSDAIAQMQAAMVLADDYRLVPTEDTPRLVEVTRRDDGHILVGGPMPPVAAHERIILKKDAEFADPTPYTTTLSANEQEELDLPDTSNEDEDGEPQQPQTDVKVVERAENGVALDGAIAYREGTPSADCPFSSEDEEGDEYERFIAWNEAWDAAADEATEEEESKGGSVVSEKYRAKYAELGHPTHCGDWLAELLNNLCITKTEGTDLGRFEAICQLNGVDTSKYRRSGIGWQGRIRMTGRNLLAKKVYLAGGVLKVLGSEEGVVEEFRAPGDWMASQWFKMSKAQQFASIPTPADAE